MRSFLILLFLLQSCFGTPLYAQSKKKNNEYLFAELATQKKIQDSILDVWVNHESSIKRAETNVFTANQLLNTTKEQVAAKRVVLAHNHELLALLGYDANSIIPFEEIMKLESPIADYELRITSTKLFRTFPWAKMDGVVSFADLKTKAQNKLLVSQIRAYDSINKINSNTVMQQRNFLDSLTIMKNNTEKEIKKYNDQIRYMVQKSDEIAIKWQEVTRQKEDADEEEYMKILKAWKKKQKPGELNFIPVRVYKNYGEAPVLSTDIKDTEYEHVLLDEFLVAPPKPEMIVSAEEPAEFPGGVKALLKYLSDNLVLPESVLKGDISGKCYLKFVVSSEGKISSIKIQRGVTDCPECDEEAKRVVEKMPIWKPATNNGQPVNQWYTLPITFKAPN